MVAHGLAVLAGWGVGAAVGARLGGVWQGTERCGCQGQVGSGMVCDGMAVLAVTGSAGSGAVGLGMVCRGCHGSAGEGFG